MIPFLSIKATPSQTLGFYIINQLTNQYWNTETQTFTPLQTDNPENHIIILADESTIGEFKYVGPPLGFGSIPVGTPLSIRIIELSYTTPQLEDMKQFSLSDLDVFWTGSIIVPNTFHPTQQIIIARFFERLDTSIVFAGYVTELNALIPLSETTTATFEPSSESKPLNPNDKQLIVMFYSFFGYNIAWE